MAENLARQLIAEHLIEGEMRPDAEIALKIDQFLLHDGTGPLCALQLEAMGVEQISAETAVAYVDHLLVEADSKNADDHILLHSAARRFGMWFSRAGNGTSHPVHQQRFGIPGKTLLGADSHTPAAGAIGMLAIGAGGLEISMALTGQPFRIRMPEIWGILLTGRLPDWVSAKQLIREGGLARLIEAGARLHQTGCNGCLGMGQAPAAGRRSLRTVTRNFPGRSGTKEDQVYLCSPETAAASALCGVITDPRRLAMPYPRIKDSGGASAYDGLIEAPLAPGDRPRALAKGPCHASLPDFEPIADELALPVLLKVGDNVSTDEIVQGGVIGLSLWSSLPGMTSLAFKPIDESYVDRARDCHGDGHAIVGGGNYGWASSREQAALAVRNLGARVVLAQSIASIHGENLVNYGVLPLLFAESGDVKRLERGATLRLRGLHAWLRGVQRDWELEYGRHDQSEGRIRVRHSLSPRQVDVLLAGGAIPWMRRRLNGQVQMHTISSS
jgi:aconitase A